MAFDSSALTAVAMEIRSALLGGRVDRVLQPEPETLVLLLYGRGRNHRLLLSAHARNARVQLTRQEKPNPPHPPNFCMLLRKHLAGARLALVEQVGRDRILHLGFDASDELGNPVRLTLVAEVMGKHSNVILLGPEGRIIDAIRRVSEAVNRYRELLPGLAYVPPPAPDKLDPAALDPAALAARLTAAAGQPVWQALLAAVDGLGPLAARDICARAGVAPGGREAAAAAPALAAAVVAHAAAVDGGDFSPVLLLDAAGAVTDFAAVAPVSVPGTARPYETVSALCDAFFSQREEAERFAGRRAALARRLGSEIDRCRRKLALQQEAQARAEGAEEYRRAAELLTAQLHAVPRGAATAELVDYYDPAGASIRVDLDPALTPQANAQAYWRRYQKARSGREQIAAQMAATADELAYLEQVEAALQEAGSLPDLEEVRAELAAEGYLPAPVPGKGDRRRRPGGGPAADKRTAAGGGAPLVVRSGDGLEIWVGRNNRQNDYLTLRLAAPTDLWLHTQKIPGSHVIVRLPPGEPVPERTLQEAALLAAYHSRARGSGQVPVDYTLRKHVRKPAGARPGMVIYDNQRTLYVTPDPEALPSGGMGEPVTP